MKWDRNCSFQKDRTEIEKIEKSSLEREDWGAGSDPAPFFRRTFWALLLIFSFFHFFLKIIIRIHCIK